ncbi:hypothetical protein MUB24_03445 [Lederbergia sp. NSJ-179]|uniref:hypothetical protein n=1 Tax=Lederbergia sp. NSJ-179 TaxID=2931402 RepID=UPI001FD118DC|nr:hypothetical protein [Lederbergia sp. NSJ-179]MCJ7839982.1 hypothetical protein [Lederbergia sp. NSJ-179]
MTLEMRELKGDDIFTLLGIVGKLGIKDEFIQLFEQNVESNADKIAAIPQDHKKKEPTKAELKRIEEEKARLEQEAQRRGMEAIAGLMQKLLLNINKIKPDINSLLADLTGKNEEEIKNLGLKEYSGLIVQFFKKPELRDFFSSIASLLQ